MAQQQQLPITTTYTTIPITGSLEPITHSHKNLTTAISRRRPWPEFLTSLSLPHSLSSASSRFRHNSSYFSVNYSILLVTSTAVSLLSTPLSLLLISALFYMWLVLHFFREDPLVVFGRVVTDFVVMLVLVLVTVGVVWVIGPISGLSYGVGVGLVGCVVHSCLRDEEGLFLDEGGAVSNGLVAGSGGISVRPPL